MLCSILIHVHAFSVIPTPITSHHFPSQQLLSPCSSWASVCANPCSSVSTNKAKRDYAKQLCISGKHEHTQRFHTSRVKLPEGTTWWQWRCPGERSGPHGHQYMTTHVVGRPVGSEKHSSIAQ